MLDEIPRLGASRRRANGSCVFDRFNVCVFVRLLSCVESRALRIGDMDIANKSVSWPLGVGCAWMRPCVPYVCPGSPRCLFTGTADRLRAGAGSWRSGSGWRQGRVRWGRPLLSRPRGVVGSGPAAVLAVVESAEVSGFGCRVVVRVCRCFWMVVRFVCVLRVSACALVCPVCVPAPPVSFYRYSTVPSAGPRGVAASTTHE